MVEGCGELSLAPRVPHQVGLIKGIAQLFSQIEKTELVFYDTFIRI